MPERLGALFVESWDGQKLPGSDDLDAVRAEGKPDMTPKSSWSCGPILARTKCVTMVSTKAPVDT